MIVIYSHVSDRDVEERVHRIRHNVRGELLQTEVPTDTTRRQTVPAVSARHLRLSRHNCQGTRSVE